MRAPLPLQVMPFQLAGFNGSTDPRGRASERSLDMGELRKLQQTLQETLRAQREQAAGDDHVAATQRQVQRVEQRIQLLKRHAPGRRWWRWW